MSKEKSSSAKVSAKSKSEKKEIVITDSIAKPDVAKSKPADKETLNKETSVKPLAGKNKKSPVLFFALFIVLLVAVACAVAGFYFWTEQQQQKDISEQQAQALLSLDRQLQKIIESTDSNAVLAISNSQQLQQMDEQIKLTETISQQAMEVVNRNQRGWALAEIDYLLRMAHQRIEVARDITGAIAALKGADARLVQLADLSLFKIRKQLAKDISSLNAIHQADVNGISLAIDQVITYLPELPFKSVKDEVREQISEDEVQKETKPEEEQSFAEYVVDAVIELGDIKIHPHEIEAASSVQQQIQIEQLLRTYLLSARLAALRFDQQQFLHEISQADEIVRNHYDENDNRVQQLKKILSDYSALQLSPDLPELTKAWTMLQKAIKSSDDETQIKPEVKK